jgi:putative hydrolase of the HAD superfamily
MQRAVLWDVGGPINTEIRHEADTDRSIRSSLAHAGIEVSDDCYQQANRYAVESFAPDAYKAIVWHVCEHDPIRARRVWDHFVTTVPETFPFDMRDGIPELLHDLHERGYAQGLVANQPTSTLAVLDTFGIRQVFNHQAVSSTLGFRKPDPRLFLAASETLGIGPPECIVVGDRIDNDISPARKLGMRTVLFATGRHVDQQPRCWDEVPDTTVRTVGELKAALMTLLDDASS